MDKDLKKKLTAKNKWFRAIFMVIFMIIGDLLAPILIGLIAIFQFIYTLFTNKPNEELLKFSGGLCKYFLQIMLYLTYRKEEKPFPFSAWPTFDCQCKMENSTKPKTKTKEKK